MLLRTPWLPATAAVGGSERSDPPQSGASTSVGGTPAPRAQSKLHSCAPVILVDGEKGGIGKSHQTRLIVHLLTTAGLQVIGADGDAGNPHLERFYAKTIKVHPFALRDQEEWFRLTDLIGATDPHAAIVIDAPAGVSDCLRAWMPTLEIALAEVGRPLLRVWVMNTLIDSVIRLSGSKDLIPLEDTVVVLNGREGLPEKFVHWNVTKLRTELIATGGHEIFVPALHQATNETVHRLQLGFADAAEELPSFSQRVTLRAWLAACSRAFEPVLPRLEGRS